MSFHGHSLPEGRVKNADWVLRRLAEYLRPYRSQMLLVLLLLVVATVLDQASPYLIGVAVDQFIDPSGAAMPGWLESTLPDGASRQMGLAVTMGLLAVTYVLSWATGGVLLFRLMVRVGQKLLLALRSEMFEQIQRLSLSFFDQHEAGDLMSRLVNDTRVIGDMFGAGLAQMLRSALGMLGILVFMFSLNWRLALASFAVLPVFLVVTGIFVRRVRTAYRETRRTIGEVSADLQENIAGVREVQAFAREDENLEAFRTTNERNRAANVQAETISAALQPALEVLSTAGLAVVIGYGGYLLLSYSPPLATVGVIIAFITYVQRFYGPIAQLAQMFGQLQSALAGAERIFELMDTQPDIVSAPGAPVLADVRGEIEFEHVSFEYVVGQPVLDDVSLRVEPGQTIAIVGPTGAGKTTIVNLLMRHYDVTAGRLLVDGHDVRSVDLTSLRQQMGVVPQDTFLFSGTVMDNIRYGRLDATDAEVIEAARQANAHSFIERMPEGYGTQVGERGASLSHGNRQLLAIARALLKDPRVLILDEATSSVDTRTELLIQRALHELLAGRTSLVIAHRLSTVRNADQILVVQQGRVVERGVHAELMAAGGLYHDLYMSQYRRQAVHDVVGAPDVIADVSAAEG